MSNGPNPCMYEMDILDAHVFYCKLPKNYNSIDIDPARLACDISSVYSNVTTNQITVKLDAAEEAKDLVLHTVYMDHPAYAEAPSMQLGEIDKVHMHHIQNLDMLKMMQKLL